MEPGLADKGSGDLIFEDMTSRAGLSFGGALGYRLTRHIDVSLNVRYINAQAKIVVPVLHQNGIDPPLLGFGPYIFAHLTKLDIGLVPVTLNVGYRHRLGGSLWLLSARLGLGGNFIASLSANEADTTKNQQGRPLYKEGRAVKKGSTFSGLSAQAVVEASYIFSPITSLGLRYTFGYDQVKLELRDKHGTVKPNILSHTVAAMVGFYF